MTWQQFLTENVLGECWHAFTFNDFGYKVCKCNGKPWIFGDSNERIDLHTNRTFTTRNDLMDLYELIEKDGKLISFLNYLNAACDWKDFDPIRDRALEYLFKWLFCLDGSGYEEKCKMVAEFYGWKEKP